ncbi:MAG: HEAT repeat domain-containing protein, partial [Candidatus Latescibacteria bacterium]|nr:HEAT repeat domain-containing protein [Candidatus Latescibacterota bacterium]
SVHIRDRYCGADSRMRRVFLPLILGLAFFLATSHGYLHPDHLELLRTATGERLDVAMGRAIQQHKAGELTPDNIDWLSRLALGRAQKEPDVRGGLITFVGQLGRSQDVPKVIPFLRDQNATVRTHAGQALGWIGDPSALAAIESARNAATDTSDPAVAQERWILTYAVGALSLRRDLTTGSDTQNLDRLRDVVMSEPHWLIRSDALRVLAGIKNRAAWNIFFDSSSRWHTPAAYRDHLAMQFMARYQLDTGGCTLALSTRNEEEQLFGLDILAEIGEMSEIGQLTSIMYTAESELVRAAAKHALERIVARQ